MTCKNEVRKLASIAVLSGAVPALAACESLALTSFGVGASTAVSHSLGGITYRTFTAPVQQVKSASIGALNIQTERLLVKTGTKGAIA